MTDAERLAAIKDSLTRAVLANQELHAKVMEYSGEQFIPQEEFPEHDTCFHEGTNFGIGAYAKTVLETYFSKEE